MWRQGAPALPYGIFVIGCAPQAQEPVVDDPPVAADIVAPEGLE